MPSSLPTEGAGSKAVHDWGIGTYDSDGERYLHGEDDEEEAHGESLPEGGGPLDPFGPDRYLSYPQTETHLSVADLPGDINRPPVRPTPTPSYIGPSIPDSETANSELPDDHDNPSSRSDYFDQYTYGMPKRPRNYDEKGVETYDDRGFDDFWPTEDKGAYAQDRQFGDSGLPTPATNEVSMDDFLGALGNAWSGYEVEDISGAFGYPSPDYKDPQDVGKNEPSALIATGNGRKMIPKNATNLELSASLAKEVLKKYGKTDLTKRHVLALLQQQGLPQYLSSDVIRCLKHNHDVHIKDVLDEFPVKLASGDRSLSNIRDEVINLEIANICDPQVSSEFRRCAADLSLAIAQLDRLKGSRVSVDPTKDYDDEPADPYGDDPEYIKWQEQGPPCPKCGGENTRFNEPMPSMMGYGEDTTLHCDDCDEDFADDPLGRGDAPAGGHAEDTSASEAYKYYVEDCEDGHKDPVSYEDFLKGKH